jgi:HNH endonuclease
VINDQNRAFVRERAADRCEYCRAPESAFRVVFVIDHITARQHGVTDDLQNLALCCPKCNRKKGPNLSGIDPESRSITPLYHPRQQSWTTHFRWNGLTVIGITAIGRATIAALDLNSSDRLRVRDFLAAEGRAPS